MILIHTTDEYLYKNKRSILILEMRVKNGFLINKDKCEELAKPQLDWFNDRGVKSFMTCSPGTMVGWFGHYYIDVSTDDKIVSEYSEQFEDSNGISLSPNEYQMILLDYDEWINSGGMKKHEEYLKDREDLNWNP